MGSPRRFTVILNEAAGRVRRDPEAVRRHITELFATQDGVAADVVVRPPAEVTQAIAAARREPCDAIVVGGGDGTIAHAAAALCEAPSIPLGVLPMGTFNLLARDLGVPASLDGAVETLSHATPLRVDVGFVNGHAFLLHASLGIHPWLIRRRDKKNPRTRIGRIVSTAKVGIRALRHAPSLDVSFHCGDDDQAVHCRALVVTVGTVEGGLGTAWRRHAPDSGNLALYTTRDDHRPLRAVWDAIRAPWHESEAMRLWLAEQLEVVSRHSPLPVALDGDVVGLDSPLRFTIVPRALEILVPDRDGHGFGT